MPHVLITGTNRGIGLELVRQYAQKPDMHIFATARDAAAPALQSLMAQHPADITRIALEVTDAASIAQAVQEVQAITAQLDVLVLNAAINPEVAQHIDTMRADTMREVFEVNTLAPLMLTQAFLPLLRASQGAKIVFISSDMASLSERTYGGSNAYCMSKTALNMLMRGTAAELRREGLIAVALDPGWVKTDMGGPQASLTPQESARGMIRVIDHLTLPDSGQFWRWDGQHNAW